MRVNDTRGMEEERRVCREAVLRCAGEVCGMRKLGCGRMRNSSQRRNGMVALILEQEKEAY